MLMSFNYYYYFFFTGLFANKFFAALKRQFPQMKNDNIVGFSDFVCIYAFIHGKMERMSNNLTEQNDVLKCYSMEFDSQ